MRGSENGIWYLSNGPTSVDYESTIPITVCLTKMTHLNSMTSNTPQKPFKICPTLLVSHISHLFTLDWYIFGFKYDTKKIKF